MKKYGGNSGVSTPNIEKKPVSGIEIGEKGNSGTQNANHDGSSTHGGK